MVTIINFELRINLHMLKNNYKKKTKTFDKIYTNYVFCLLYNFL